MPQPQKIPKENYRRSTWKNGLGFTDEIAIHPPESNLVQGNFLWRLSSARIEKASPFSMFPNHDRLLLVLKGAGMRLIHTMEEGGDEDSSEVPPLEPYEFPGDIQSRCELIDGPVVDFSIFLRKGEVEPLVRIEEIAGDETFSWEPEGNWNFIFVLQGSLESDAGALREGDTLRVDAPVEAVAELRANTASRLLVISLA